MKPQKAPPKAYSETEIVRLVWLAIFVSVFSFLFYYRHEDVLLYGDAVAHINIARRVFDSKTPGLLQLGTVWLPLPHLLIVPFILSKQMWQSGSGARFPRWPGSCSECLESSGWCATAFGRDGEMDFAAKIGAWASALVYGANPNLIYMQATAMGESVYLAFFIWAVVYFAEFARRGAKASRALTKCGLCLFAACLTRYDGWFLAVFLIACAVAASQLLAKDARNGVPGFPVPSLGRMLPKFILLAAAGPALWLGYNAIVYRNPLEFANGPYSAKAIEQKTATVNPAKGNLLSAGSVFSESRRTEFGRGELAGTSVAGISAAGSLVTGFSGRGRAALLLWVPLPFYALSVAYGSVPIFVPTWWPFSNYNLRYGLQLLPAFAVFVPLAIAFIVHSATKILVSKFPGASGRLWSRWWACVCW